MATTMPIRGTNTKRIIELFAENQLNSKELPANNSAKRKATHLYGKLGGIIAKFESIALLDNVSNQIKTLLDQMKALPNEAARQTHGLYTKQVAPALQEAEQNTINNKELAGSLKTYQEQFLASMRDLFALIKQAKERANDKAGSQEIVGQLKKTAADVAKYADMLRKYEVSYNDTSEVIYSIRAQLESSAKVFGIGPQISAPELPRP